MKRDILEGRREERDQGTWDKFEGGTLSFGHVFFFCF